jgi:hypothetical protein
MSLIDLRKADLFSVFSTHKAWFFSAIGGLLTKTKEWAMFHPHLRRPSALCDSSIDPWTTGTIFQWLRKSQTFSVNTIFF